MNITCPHCGYDTLERVSNTNGTYECYQCGGKTHEKIEERRSDLEDLAARDDMKSSTLAALLVEGENA